MEQLWRSIERQPSSGATASRVPPCRAPAPAPPASLSDQRAGAHGPAGQDAGGGTGDMPLAIRAAH
jgi:hypothetical protein